MISEDDFESRLKMTSAAVEATSFEQCCLWAENAADPSPMQWKEINSGWIETIGTIDSRPISLALFWSVIDGKLVMFWDVVSQVSDKEQIDLWLQRHFPPRRPGERRTVDAGNFGPFFVSELEA